MFSEELSATLAGEKPFRALYYYVLQRKRQECRRDDSGGEPRLYSDFIDVLTLVERQQVEELKLKRT